MQRQTNRFYTFVATLIRGAIQSLIMTEILIQAVPQFLLSRIGWWSRIFFLRVYDFPFLLWCCFTASMILLDATPRIQRGLVRIRAGPLGLLCLTFDIASTWVELLALAAFVLEGYPSPDIIGAAVVFGTVSRTLYLWGY
ncbi:hypothetical protein F5Y16DRAFT_405948 [Xylariaceae sp. FL0255]|nr:hypothetical protein F5Y16DRAFT_405948 [Xylariaceae sp. FL0255]